ncbi:MAG TPA: choice-of-anchor B family protein [Candidatus Eisenbacteria bacterium]|jgi:choice-of-anchor B domain-containing protein|nr:choice-of-anchor B family protein [Candidatus Eisenbacteria bacterium]
MSRTNRTQTRTARTAGTARTARIAGPAAVVLLAALLALAAPVLAQDSRNVTLLSHVNPYPNMGKWEWAYSTAWAYVAPDGREYGVLASLSGISVFRLTDPTQPVQVGFINLRDSGWHESRQYGTRLYITTEVFNGEPAIDGLVVIDMSDPEHPQKIPYASTIQWAHSLEVDTARGLLYTNGTNRGVVIYSLANPDNPVEISTLPFYAHDTHIRGTRAYASRINEGLETILDMTNPAAPVELASFQSPLRITHSAWTTEDGRYLYVTDESKGKNLNVYDISNLSSIQRVWKHERFQRDVVHHPRIKGNTAFISHYTRGVRLLDLRNGAWPVEYAYYDQSSYPYYGTNGNWEVCPFFPSGIFVISDTFNGMWVFRYNGAAYGIVRGTVRDNITGQPIEAATLQVTGLSTTSGGDGRYGFAPSPGRITITTSAFGYVTDSKTITLGSNEDRTLDVTLTKHPGSVRGLVTSAGGGGLAFAELDIAGTPLHVVSDGTGAFLFPEVPPGTYSLRCARPGYATRSSSIVVQQSKETGANFALPLPSFYDDFETDRGWVVGGKDDTASGGLWARGVPSERCDCFREDPYLIRPGSDHTPDPGTLTYATGPGRFDSFPDGLTTLTSPALSLAGLSDPRIGYWRWFINQVSGIAADDPLVVDISGDGVTWTNVTTLIDPPVGWEYAEIRVRDFVPTGNAVQVRFRVNEQGQFSLNRALVDDVALFQGAGGGGGMSASMVSGTNDRALVIGRVGPSPARGSVRMSLSLAGATRVSASVFDAQGRLVANIADGAMAAGPHTLEWNGRSRSGETAAAGIYFMEVKAGTAVKRDKFVMLR